MVTGQQVRRLRQKLMQGKTQEAAAAAAGMSVRSAGKWQRGLLPAERKSPRTWRTRPDPFTGIWNDVIEPLLRRDPESALQATTVLDWLEERYPGRFSPAQLRTLQRRLRDWRALHGPGTGGVLSSGTSTGPGSPNGFHRRRRTASQHRRSALSPPLLRVHPQPPRGGDSWTWPSERPLKLCRRGCRVRFGPLGGLPQVVRTDNLSAATHELKETKGRTLTQRYAALLEHYGLQATRTNPRSSHENGVAEQAHYRLKTALAQALIIRGSRDFPSVAGYSAFVQGVVDKSNRRVQGKLDVERPYLRSLPPGSGPGIHHVAHQGQEMEHHPGDQQDLQRTLPVVRPRGESSPVRRLSGGLLQRPHGGASGAGAGRA